ncbi:ribosome maturation factor RimP [Pseudactinotalea sp. HY158]|uniref:ribosome maturation factor RimP n=1 Tax=Pseudactinotalea sp. HY158 TaxID=2654547 RepID=UPI00129CF43A|nr:ribosome maturation factor RimP [Pseudactinotalea sp. HY158]QGH69886.1 ribosome maturation factor RimP [Pseudactinotalea sp. HY158]
MAAERTDLRTALTSVLTPVVAHAGLFLEDVALTGPAKHRTLRVIVDLPDGPGGVDSDRLADVTRAVSGAMDDVADRIPGSYTLEVTTAGADRTLTTARHFRRAEGRSVTLTTEDGSVTGRVVAADDAQVVLRTEAGETAVALATVRSGRINLDFRPAADHA